MSGWNSYAAYVAKNATPMARIQALKLGQSAGVGSAGIPSSLFTIASLPGAAPTTAVACNNATVGALAIPTSSGVVRIPRALSEASGNDQGYFLLMDRLSHQGGLSGTTTGAQTTNLPTAALTRFTSGVGVRLGIEVYVSVGATPTTIVCSYTNQAGTAGRTTPAMGFGSTALGFARSIGQLLWMPLQAGDTGVRSVESVTIGASTGTAGNFGVTLFRPIGAFLTLGSLAARFDQVLHGALMFEPMNPAACLMIGNANVAGSTVPTVFDIPLLED